MVDCHFLLLLNNDDTVIVEITEVILDMSTIKGFLEVLELDQGTKHERLTLELIDFTLERTSLANLLILLVVLFHTRTIFIGYILFLFHTDQSQSLFGK